MTDLNARLDARRRHAGIDLTDATIAPMRVLMARHQAAMESAQPAGLPASPPPRPVKSAEERERERRMQDWERTEFPRLHRDALRAGLSWPDGGAAFNRLRLAVATQRCACLLGDRGPGKTQMATAVAFEVYLNGDSVRYRDTADLISDFRAACYSGGQSEHDGLRTWANVGLLIIDDVHDRRGTDDEDQVLGRLLKHRYNAKRSTILISNETPEAFRTNLGRSIADRLNEWGEMILLRWPSMRKPPAPTG